MNKIDKLLNKLNDTMREISEAVASDDLYKHRRFDCENTACSIRVLTKRLKQPTPAHIALKEKLNKLLQHEDWVQDIIISPDHGGEVLITYKQPPNEYKLSSLTKDEADMIKIFHYMDFHPQTYHLYKHLY